MAPSLIFAWGADSYGQCCTGEDDGPAVHRHPLCVSATVCRGVPAGMPIVAVASGEAHTLFLSGYGDVFACGRSREGQLGLGSVPGLEPAVRSPRAVEALRPWHVARIACGSKHCLAVSSEGKAFEWGMLLSLEKVADTADWANRRGGLGRDFKEDLNERQQRIVALSWKRYLKNSADASLNDSDSEEDGSSLRALERAECRRFAVRAPRPCVGLDGMGGVCAAACGFAHSTLVLAGGGIVAAGYGEKGQLGNGERFPSAMFLPVSLPPDARAASAGAVSGALRAGAPRPVLACGHNHTAAVMEPSGRLLAWGLGVFGQLGLGKATKESCLPAPVRLPGQVVEVACGDHHTLALTASGQLFAFGHRDAVGGVSHLERLPEPVAELSQVERLFAGGTGCFALSEGPLSGGGPALQAWGYNQNGLLGRSLAELQLLRPGPTALPRHACSQARALGVGAGHCVAVCEVPACCVLPQDTPTPFLGCAWLRESLLGEPAFDTLVCAGAGGKELLGAHRAVLAARCPLLAARLQTAQEPAERPWTLDVSGRSVPCVAALLEYLYTDFCRPAPDAAADLRPWAEALRLQRLAAGLAAGAETASLEAGMSWVRKEGGGWRQVQVDACKAPEFFPPSQYESDLDALVVEGKTEEPGYVALAIREVDTPSEPTIISVARPVLLAVDYFRALLEGGFAEAQRLREGGEQPLEVTADGSAQALVHCLRLFATGRTGLLAESEGEEALEVLAEAHRLCLPGLVEAAAAALFAAASSGHAPSELAAAASLYGLPHLGRAPAAREASA